MINRRNLSVDDKELPVTGRNGSAWRRRLPGMTPRTIAILAAGAMTVAGCTSANASNTPSNPGPDADPDLPSHPPCPAPHGGWPTGPRDENFDFSPVTSYAAAHPGTVLAPAELRPSATQTVAYALTTADPRTVTKALRPYYGARLCVERSRYTQAAINRAAAVFVRRMNGSDGIWSVGSGGLDLRAQPSVDVYLVRVTPAIAALAAAQPAGLVLLHPWLFPVKQ